MTNILRKSALALAIATVTMAAATNVTMHTAPGFQVLSVSANGQWASGAYLDESMNTRAFRWNLLSDKIEMLDGADVSVGWDIANDGTVSGDYLNSEWGINLPGYWRDGAWQMLDMPVGTTVSDGIGGCITPDGHYMTGALCLDGTYKPFIWHDGEGSRMLPTDYDAVAMAIAPDGQAAAGFDSPNNRVNCYWPPTGDSVYFMDSPEYSRGPWSYARNFSPDGSKLVYWGGWDYDEEADQNWLYCVYDVATGERKKLTAPSYDSDMEFYDISNSGLCVGYNHNRGYVHDGQQGMYIDDYLLSRGLDLSTYADFYNGNDYYTGQLPIFRVVSISGDGNVMAMEYYNGQGQSVSLVVKFDQDFTTVTPLDVTARQLTGVNAVTLNWARTAGANNVRGYNIYRNGQKINGIMPINALTYYDRNLADGTYQYEVSAVTTAGVETKAQPVTVTVGPEPLQRPSALFARQKGVNNALLTWRPALNNLTHKHYFDIDQDLLGNFAVYADVTIETAVRFDRAEMACYDGFTIDEVSFVPMNEHFGWTVNIYTLADNGELQLIASQPVTQQLALRQLNTVKLQQPIAVPDATLVVAIECEVNSVEGKVIGNDMTRATAGYSDLLRMSTEPEFYSAYEASLESGMFLASYSWAIDLGLKSPTYEGDQAYTYQVTVDGSHTDVVSETATTIASVGEGPHTAQVRTVSGDKLSEPVSATFNVRRRLPKVTNVAVNGSQPAVISWQAPADNDPTAITYSNADQPTTAIQGNGSDDYSMLIATKYPASMFRGYDGYKVSALRYYPMAQADYSFVIYQNDQEVLFVDAPRPILNQWNEVACPGDLVIDANSEYMMVIDIYEPAADTGVMGLDNGLAVSGCGDLYSPDGGMSWESLSDQVTVRGNWMMGMVITDPDGQAVDIDGYDVVIDSRAANADMVTTTTSYEHDFGKTDGSTHTVRIDAYLHGERPAVKGETVYFTLQTSGIEDLTAPVEITLQRGANVLVAEGDGVVSMSVVAASGIEMARARGHQVDISHLRPGVYLVRILASGSVITRKITIK